MRTLRVTGKGTIKAKPDTTRLSITLCGTYDEYRTALRHSAEDTKILRTELKRIGLNKEDLKTVSFDIDTKYDSYQDKYNNYRRRFVGYEYTHQLKIEFLSDNTLLGRILGMLSMSPVDPEFRISFILSDPEEAKNELLGRAVTDAKEKAEVLSRAAGLRLGEIQSIDYSWGRIDFEFSDVNLCMSPVDRTLEDSRAMDIDIDPDDIQVSDTVTVIWEITE